MAALGFDTETQVGITHYHQTFLHPTLGAVVERIIKENNNVQKIIIRPVLSKLVDESIVTEQNIRININEKGIQIGML